MYGKRIKLSFSFGLFVGTLSVGFICLNICGQSLQPATGINQNNIVQPDDAVFVIENRTPQLWLAAQVLEQMYRKPVSFEGPIDLPWDGDVDLMPGGENNERMLRFPKPIRFVIPEGVKPDRNQQFGVGVLEKLLDAYHKQVGDSKYKIVSTESRLHIVVDQVRDENGQFVKAETFLDKVITIPSEKRFGMQHLDKIVAAVNALNDVKLRVISGSAGVDTMWQNDISEGILDRKEIAKDNGTNWFEPKDYSDLTKSVKDKLEFEWGVNNVVAREALAELLEKSHTTLSYRLSCADIYTYENRCWVEIDHLTENYLERGIKLNRPLLYDRINK